MYVCISDVEGNVSSEFLVTRYATSFFSSLLSSLAITTACDTSGCWSSKVSISPSSIRKPRILT
ncbi:MAG: hypothetical protein IPK14_03040 [Blastocatellia bacterium]|nr:hypothetical protein [Blastocatellia bacterium]